MLIIREATIDDLQEILKIYVDSGLDIEVLELEKAKKVFQKISQYPYYKVFVAEFEKVLIGTFAILIMDNLAHCGTPLAIIEDVGVLSEYQNKGFGKEMMDFAIRKAKDKGCYKMVLSSNKLRKKAHSFYESLGFEKHGFSFLIEVC